MKTFNKITSIVVCVGLVVTFMFPVLASSNVQAAVHSSSMDAIIDEYHYKNWNIDAAKNCYSNSKTKLYSSETYKTQKYQVLQDSVAQLQAVGYEAYGVTSDNFDEIEELLQTDFSDMGMTPETSFIAIIHGENGKQARETASNDFNYTYNGTTYVMRYLTLTASDNSAYGKVTSFDIEGSVMGVFNNVLNTAISAALDSVTVGLGTIYSIASPDWLSKYETRSRTLYLDCATNWTRTFTQVWSTEERTWVYGAMVEKANMAMILHGTAYDENLNKYTAVAETQSEKTQNSEHYLDPAWQKQKAAQCMTTGIQAKDVTGSIKYYAAEGSTQKHLCTHTESF